MAAELLLFAGVSALVIITPGQDTALAVRNAVIGGRSAGLATAAGVAAGQLIWAVAAALGLVAILAATEVLFTAIRYAGAAYLIYLGVQSLRAALKGRAMPPGRADAAPSLRLAPRKALLQGFISNLGNPKMAIFFASLLPQFVPQGAPAFASMLLLGMTFCVMILGWLSFYAVAIDRAGRYLSGSGIGRAVDGIAGAALIAMGLRVALTEK